MTKSCPYTSEAEMVADWLATLRASKQGEKWTVYAETAGWDLLLVHVDGYQLGLEAKLSLNAKVLAQALAGSQSYWRDDGPDYRGILVPSGGSQLHIGSIARALGLGILSVRPRERGTWNHIELPDENSFGSTHWPCWLPSRRCKLPEYVPDVEAGHSAPVQLTDWKIRAIKLMILLERRGYITRADMKALQISPTRWTDHWHGFLAVDKAAGGYVRCDRTPDLRAQHPVNYDQIEADFEKWCPPGYRPEFQIGATA